MEEVNGDECYGKGYRLRGSLALELPSSCRDTATANRHAPKTPMILGDHQLYIPENLRGSLQFMQIISPMVLYNLQRIEMGQDCILEVVR